MITLTTALNLFWAIASLALCVRLYRRSSALAGSRRRKLAAVSVVALSLFPVVSTSDDLIRFAFLDSFIQTSSGAGGPSEDGSGQSNQTQLARVLDTLDSAQITPVFSLSATLVAFRIAPPPVTISQERPAASYSGRAPPAA